jgi:cation diffusion facilitator family transporter
MSIHQKHDNQTDGTKGCQLNRMENAKKKSGHGHSHGTIDSKIITTDRGKWAVKWSFAILMATACLQVIIVYVSGSVALLADTVHNFGDALTSIPLWIAFVLVRRKPNKRFTYGYGRMEDLAGAFIILVILVSAITAGYKSIDRFIHPATVRNLWTVVAAAFIGFLGNEWVARFRIKVGKEINSAALVADGKHARVDGLTSLGVLIGVLGIWMGYPMADPIAGVFITLAIFRIVWTSGKSVFFRMLDGINPSTVDEIRDSVAAMPAVHEVTEIRVRWIGHQLHAEINITVKSDLTVAQGHDIAVAVKDEILHHLPYLWDVIVHVDPKEASGETHH